LNEFLKCLILIQNIHSNPFFQVWDYVGDNYVHRLIQSKTDGKLVEVPSPASTSWHQGANASRMLDPHGRPSLGYGSEGDVPFNQVDEDLKEAMIASKLDSISQGMLRTGILFIS